MRAYLFFAPMPPPQPRTLIGAVFDLTLHGGDYSSLPTIPVIPRALPFSARPPMAHKGNKTLPVKPAKCSSPTLSHNLLTGVVSSSNGTVPAILVHGQCTEGDYFTYSPSRYDEHRRSHPCKLLSRIGISTM